MTDRQLDEKHRKAQLVLRAATLKDLLKLWPAFDLNDIPRTWDAFLAAVVLLMKARGTTSGALARAYLREYDGELPNLVELDEDKARAGLTVVGPINATKQLQAGRPLDVVRANALVLVSGEVTRHVLNMGRATLMDGLDLNARRGLFRPRWRRVTDTDPCNWCSEQSALTFPMSARFKSHGHCSCFPAPA